MLIHSGNGWSTHDVYVGLLAGFKSQGVDVVPYRLDERITAAGEWIRFCREREGDETEVDRADMLYQAGKGAAVRVIETLPDAVVIVSGLLVEHRTYTLLHRLGIPLVLFATECPYEDDYYYGRAPFCDVVTVNDPVSIEPILDACRVAGRQPRIEYMPLGYAPEIHHPGVGKELPDVPAHDVVFVGTGFPERIRFLESIDWTGIDFGLYGHWDGVADDSPLRAHVRGKEVDNPWVAAMYDRAKVVLNLFRVDVWRGNEVQHRAGGTSISPRLIEAGAIGACVASESRPEVATVFGDSIATFETPDECGATLRRLLADSDQRARMRREIQACVAGYSYHDRARQILDLIESSRSARAA